MSWILVPTEGDKPETPAYDVCEVLESGIVEIAAESGGQSRCESNLYVFCSIGSG